MDLEVVREALASAGSALLSGEVQKVEDNAVEVADLIGRSYKELKLHEVGTLHLQDTCKLIDHVCAKLTDNVNLLHQMLFTLVPPLIELIFALERFCPAYCTERAPPLLQLISTMFNASEAVLLFNHLVPILER
jgi:hypothetical protein